MALTYPSEWRFGTPKGLKPAPQTAVNALLDLVREVASTEEYPQVVVETFKRRYGSQHASSSLDWSYSDLSSAMEETQKNQAKFIEAFWLALEDLAKKGVAVPSAEVVDAILFRTGCSLELVPPEIRPRRAEALLVSAEETSYDPTPQEGGLSSRYRKGEFVKRGGFGEVYMGKRITAYGEFDCAIKFFDPSPFLDREKAEARFFREVQALSGLQHRGVVQYLDAGKDIDGRLFFVMPFVVGEDLRDATSFSSPAECVDALAEVLLAVEYVHAQGVFHRDLKPSNIMVRASDRQPIVLDFGVAYLQEEVERQRLTSNFVGSLGYIPPEIIAGAEDRGPGHDVYSCAVLMYEVIARRIPNPQEYVPLPVSGGVDLRGLGSVLRRALGPAAFRPGRAGELREELLRVRRTL